LFDLHRICLLIALLHDHIVIGVIGRSVFRCRECALRDSRVGSERHKRFLVMNPELKKPDAVYLAVRIELSIRIVTKVFQQPQILPASRSDGFVPSAGDQDKDSSALLLNQSLVWARERLLSNPGRRRVGQDTLLKPVLEGIFTDSVNALHSSHDYRPGNGGVPQVQPYPACIRNPKRPEYILVRIQMANRQTFNCADGHHVH
jgi:hypothetical protein